MEKEIIMTTQKYTHATAYFNPSNIAGDFAYIYGKKADVEEYVEEWSNAMTNDIHILKHHVSLKSCLAFIQKKRKSITIYKILEDQELKPMRYKCSEDGVIYM